MSTQLDGVRMADVLDTTWDSVAQYGREACR